MFQMVWQVLLSCWQDLMHEWDSLGLFLQIPIVVMTPILVWGFWTTMKNRRRRNMLRRRRTPPR